MDLKELYQEIKKIEEVLTIFKSGGDLMVNIATQQQLNVILGKLKEAYPTVKYPLKIDSCSGCIRNFLGDLLPVFDRLKKYNQESDIVEQIFDIVENVTDEELTNATLEEVKKPIKKTTSRRKGKK